MRRTRCKTGSHRFVTMGWRKTFAKALLIMGPVTLGCGAPEEGMKDSDFVGAGREALLGQTATPLPEPAVWRVPRPTMTAEAARRQTEVDRFLALQHRNHIIRATTQTYSGDIYDWIDPKSIPGSDATPPLPLESKDRPVLTELDAYPELRGPAGTIPVLRHDYGPYVRGASNAPSLESFILSMPSGQPSGQFRLYGGYAAVTQNHGVHSSINQFPGSAESGTFTILEDAVNCDGTNPSTTKEIVGAVVGRGAAGFDGSTLRFNTEFWTAGNSAGNNVGGWNTSVTGWVPYSGAPYGPGVQLTFISVPGGSQYESPNVYVQKNATGWWIAHNGQWLGYYPSSLFDLINNSACQMNWYGEVYDPTPTSWTTNDMGEGGYASAGFGYASYHHDIWYYTTGDVATWAGSGNTGLVNPIDTHCYTTSAWNAGTALGSNWFYLGGPGHTSTNGCN